MIDDANERLVKSVERIRDLGEVFTPSVTVQAMLDMLPARVWATHPSHTFLEPACGDGNFLVAILQRKLAQVAKDFRNGRLPAGATAEAVQFHALQALASVYAVDISVENVVGGTPGHEVGARSRLLELLGAWCCEILGTRMSSRSPTLRAARWILDHNILVGNMLPTDSAGRPTGRDDIPLIEYSFEPSTQTVALSKTTMGDAVAAGERESGTVLSLFGPAAPVELWRGPVFGLMNAGRVESPPLRGEARNGRERIL